MINSIIEYFKFLFHLHKWEDESVYEVFVKVDDVKPGMPSYFKYVYKCKVPGCNKRKLWETR